MIPLRSLLAPLALALLSVSSAVQAGQFTISPGTVAIDRGQQTSDLVITYQAGTGIKDAGTGLTFNMDQLGWVHAEAIVSPTTDYATNCSIHGGVLNAIVDSRNQLPIPTAAPIPVCRFRVRAHSHAIQGIRTISATAFEYPDFFHPIIVPVTPVRIVVQ